MRTGKRQKKSRGSIMLLAIFFLILLFALSVTFFRIIPAEFHSATQARRDVQSQYATDAGIRHSYNWLQAQDSKNIPPASVEAFNNANNDQHLADNKLDNDWSYGSEIDLNHSEFFRRVYVLKSTAYFRGRPVRESISTVQNESFAKYALFFDKWGADMLFGLSGNGIQGPIHTNEFFRLQVANKNYWNSAEPWVNGPLAEMTHAKSFKGASFGGNGDGAQYYGGNDAVGSNSDLVPFDASGNPKDDRYNKVVKGGREKIRLIQEIPFPKDSTDLRAKAWGDTLPKDITAWKAIYDNKGPVLVQTTAGPNDPTGEVTGGIFISGASDASDVLLDITPEGLQKTRIKQGKATVPGPTSTSWKVDTKNYEVAYQIDVNDTKRTCKHGVRQVPNIIRVACKISHTEANAAHCGTTTTLITENGISTPVTVPKTCTWEEDGKCDKQDGTKDEKYDYDCVDTVTGSHKETAYKPAAQGDPGAYYKNTTTSNASEGDPGAYSVTTGGTKQIDEWNSVVEVNKADYHIPYYSGMKINGVVVTSSSDPKLTVPDGNTVTIRNDFSDANGNYAEYTVIKGRTNGIVFSDNNLKGVRGTNKGAYYPDSEGNLDFHGRVIAANIQNKKDIEIKDSVLQYYDGTEQNGKGENLNDGTNRLATGNTSPNEDHILGFIGRNISIQPSGNASNFSNSNTTKREAGLANAASDGRGYKYKDPVTNVVNPFRGGSFKGGINLYGILMAGVNLTGTVEGGFGAHNDAMGSGDGLGDFNLFGGIISGVARKTQTGFVPSNSAAYSTGFRLGLNYDEVAAEFLENFPITNTYKVLRYVSFHSGSTYDKND